MPPPRHAPAGLTLLELLQALLLVSLLCVALPQLAGTLRSQQADGLRRELQASLANARATAITTRRRTAVCPSSDGRACGGRWDEGWLIFHAGATRGGPGDASQILRQHRIAPRPGLRATGTHGRPVLYFQPDGRSGNSNQTITICQDGVVRAQIITNIAGRVRSRRGGPAGACG